MKRLSVFLSIVWVIALQGSIAVTTASSHSSNNLTEVQAIQPGLEIILNRLPPGERTTVIVSLRKELDLSMYAAISTHSRQARRAQLISRLRGFASASQKDLLSQVQEWEGRGTVSQVVPFWIINAFSLTATAEVIRALAEHPEVAAITPELIVHAPEEPYGPAVAPINLDQIGVTQVWQQGYQGQGIVVASLDTGVDYTHPDLNTNWRGGTNSWYDPFGEHPDTPTTITSHGTWTMGVMVGSGANGTTTGIAPQAQWISAKIFDDSGIATETAIHLSYQWLLDPDNDPQTDDAPDVVNNSWGFDVLGCITSLRQDLIVLRAAGILPVFSAGNSGPNANSSVSPANNPEALSVGAINNDTEIHPSSSRGPSACDAEEIYPALVAPGERVLTTGPQNSYANPSGTSLAAPHVTGALALLLSVNPDLSVDEQENLLLQTAHDLGTAGPDNDYGYGLIDVWAAFQQLKGEQIPAYDWFFFLPFLTTEESIN